LRRSCETATASASASTTHTTTTTTKGQKSGDVRRQTVSFGVTPRDDFCVESVKFAIATLSRHKSTPKFLRSGSLRDCDRATRPPSRQTPYASLTHTHTHSVRRTHQKPSPASAVERADVRPPKRAVPAPAAAPRRLRVNASMAVTMSCGEGGGARATHTIHNTHTHTLSTHAQHTRTHTHTRSTHALSARTYLADVHVTDAVERSLLELQPRGVHLLPLPHAARQGWRGGLARGAVVPLALEHLAEGAPMWQHANGGSGCATAAP
jgi:hypothetical protein